MGGNLRQYLYHFIRLLGLNWSWPGCKPEEKEKAKVQSPGSKYVATHSSQLHAVETTGVLGEEAMHVFREVGRLTRLISNDPFKICARRSVYVSKHLTLQQFWVVVMASIFASFCIKHNYSFSCSLIYVPMVCMCMCAIL